MLARGLILLQANGSTYRGCGSRASSLYSRGSACSYPMHGTCHSAARRSQYRRHFGAPYQTKTTRAQTCTDCLRPAHFGQRQCTRCRGCGSTPCLRSQCGLSGSPKSSCAPIGRCGPHTAGNNKHLGVSEAARRDDDDQAAHKAAVSDPLRRGRLTRLRRPRRSRCKDRRPCLVRRQQGL